MHATNAAGYHTTGNWGARPFSEDTMLPILKNRFYLGEVFYKGEWLPGKHPAAIDGETWEHAQEQLHRRAAKRVTTKTTDRIYPLRKLLYCATCGRLLRGHTIKGERRYRDPARDYDECCPEPQSIKAVFLEERVGTFLSKIRLPDDWKIKVLAQIGESGGAVDQEQQMRASLQKQLERNKRLFVIGDLSEREYLAERKRIQNELAALRPAKSKIPDLELAVLMLENFGDLWGRATDVEKCRLLHAFVEKAWVQGGQIIALEPRSAMYTLLTLCESKSIEDPEWAPISVLAPGSGAPSIAERMAVIKE